MRIGKDQVHFAWDNTLEPALEVRPGATVELDLMEPSGGQFTPESTSADVRQLDFGRVNPVTGPIRVPGTGPGDGVVVRILELDVGTWGWSALIPGFGLLADDFPEPLLVHHRRDGDWVDLGFGPRLPARPMIGTLGLALPEPGAHSLVPPSRYGGNMDVRHLVAGSSIVLPVGVPGALLSMGDAHAAMGDGEVCGTGVETSARALVQIDVASGTAPRCPVIETVASTHRTGPSLVTTGVEPDLFAAARDAVRSMIDELTRRTFLSPEHCYLLASLSADLVISEIVDAPNWIVSLHLPLDILD